MKRILILLFVVTSFVCGVVSNNTIFKEEKDKTFDSISKATKKATKSGKSKLIA